MVAGAEELLYAYARNGHCRGSRFFFWGGGGRGIIRGVQPSGVVLQEFEKHQELMALSA